MPFVLYFIQISFVDNSVHSLQFVKKFSALARINIRSIFVELIQYGYHFLIITLLNLLDLCEFSQAISRGLHDKWEFHYLLVFFSVAVVFDSFTRFLSFLQPFNGG